MSRGCSETPKETGTDTEMEGHLGEDSRAERSKHPKEKRSLGSRGDRDGTEEGIEVAEERDPGGARDSVDHPPLPPTCPPGGAETTTPEAGPAEGSKVRCRAGVLSTSFGWPPLTVQPLG